MVSSREQSKGCFATFVERKSGLYTAIKLPDRTANSMENAIKENLGLDLYFADPYCTWQRGSSENSNGLLREFYFS